jgi:hypothetical protein
MAEGNETNRRKEGVVIRFIGIWKNDAEIHGDQMSLPEVDQINAHWNTLKALAESEKQQVVEADVYGTKQQKRSVNENQNPGIYPRIDKNPKQIPR